MEEVEGSWGCGGAEFIFVSGTSLPEPGMESPEMLDFDEMKDLEEEDEAELDREPDDGVAPDF